MTPPGIQGFGHIDFTVTDSERSARWWTEVLGFQELLVTEREGFQFRTLLHPSGLPVSFVTHDGVTQGRFDEHTVGLDHIAFNVTGLAEWIEHLDRLAIPHSGAKDENGGPLLTLRDPDNIQIELHAFDPDLVKL